MTEAHSAETLECRWFISRERGFLEPGKANPYRIEITLPELSLSSYQVWTHDGSGAAAGWSEARSFEVTADAPRYTEREVDVTAFGAIPNNGRDDRAAILRAIDAVARQGGGTVLFPAGEFTITAPIDITSDRIRLLGAGMGY